MEHAKAVARARAALERALALRLPTAGAYQ